MEGDPILNLFDLVHNLARFHGMGLYFDRIKTEILQKQAKVQEETLNRGKMFQILKNTIPIDNQILLVHAKTGKERRLLHDWATINQLKSIPICLDIFPEVRGWKCKLCEQIYYDEEIYSQSDWSSDGTRYFGEYVECPTCEGDSYYNTSEPYDEEDDTIKPISVMLNGVAIGNNIEHMKKILGKKTRKKGKRTTKASKISEDFDNLIHHMPLREYKIITSSEEIQ